jgi:hypothetical protein
MLKTIVVFVALVCLLVPAGHASPQDNANPNVMWCSARSGKTIYYSAWFPYAESRMDAHRTKFQKDTAANYSLKSLEAPTCKSFLDSDQAAAAFDTSVKTQKKSGFKVVTTGWMPE